MKMLRLALLGSDDPLTSRDIGFALVLFGIVCATSSGFGLAVFLISRVQP